MSEEMTPEKRMELEADDEFTALRHRYYKLGTARRRSVLAKYGTLPEKLTSDRERRALFIIVAAGMKSDLTRAILEAEVEIDMEKTRFP